MISGADLYGLILKDDMVRGTVEAPIAQNTVFGWILFGIVDPQNYSIDSSHDTVYYTIPQSWLEHTLSRFWEIEELPSRIKLSSDYCDQYFTSSYSSNYHGRFVVRLPFARREAIPDYRES